MLFGQQVFMFQKFKQFCFKNSVNQHQPFPKLRLTCFQSHPSGSIFSNVLSFTNNFSNIFDLSTSHEGSRKVTKNLETQIFARDSLIQHLFGIDLHGLERKWGGKCSSPF